MLPLLLAASTDSVTSAPVAAPACHAGPLQPGSWGLGFRAFGNSPEIRLRRAVNSGVAVGLNLSFWGNFENAPTSQTTRSEIQSDWDARSSTSTTESDQEETRIRLRAELPLEWHRALPHGLRTVAALGLFYARSQVESQGDINNGAGYASFDKDESYDNSIGLAGSLGVAWEFVPGLCLASSFGADAYKSWGETYSSREPYGDQWTKVYQYRKSSSSGYGTTSWFGGFGLDAWF